MRPPAGLNRILGHDPGQHVQLSHLRTRLAGPPIVERPRAQLMAKMVGMRLQRVGRPWLGQARSRDLIADAMLEDVIEKRAETFALRGIRIIPIHFRSLPRFVRQSFGTMVSHLYTRLQKFNL